MGPGAVRSGDRVDRDWDLWWRRFVAVVPWVLLLPTAVVVLASPGRDPREWAAVAGLVLAAAAWVLVGYRVAWRRDRPAASVVYFVGLVVLCVLLMRHDQLFLVFAITPFFQAMLLPWPWAFAGVAATSIALHSTTMGFPGTGGEMPFAQRLFLFSAVVGVQTVAIGGGLVVADRSARQSRERQEMVAGLEAALEENAALHARLLEQAREAAVVGERQRMAREIHDTLAQGLTGVITQIQAAQRTWEDPELARPHLERALESARESLAEARRSVQALRPRQLAEGQLPEALEELVRRWSAEHAVDAAVEVTGDRRSLGPAVEVSLFRVAQEALTNVARHARASRVGLTLSYADDVVLLDVRDDGVGMAAGEHAGFGLKSMEQRIRGVGGLLRIESDGEGTAIGATVPAPGVEEP